MRVQRLGVLVWALAAAALPACSHGYTEKTAQGDVTVSQDAGAHSLTFAAKNGSMTFGGASFDPNRLALPVYPGASPVESILSKDRAGKARGYVILETSDTFEAVYRWYQGHLPKNLARTVLSEGARKEVLFVDRTGAQSGTATLMGGPGKTTIQLTGPLKT